MTHDTPNFLANSETLAPGLAVITSLAMASYVLSALGLPLLPLHLGLRLSPASFILMILRMVLGPQYMWVPTLEGVSPASRSTEICCLLSSVAVMFFPLVCSSTRYLARSARSLTTAVTLMV